MAIRPHSNILLKEFVIFVFNAFCEIKFAKKYIGRDKGTAETFLKFTAGGDQKSKAQTLKVE